jgi:hypothetical protein
MGAAGAVAEVFSTAATPIHRGRHRFPLQPTRRLDKDVAACRALAWPSRALPVPREQDAGRIVARAGSFILRNVCGDHADLSVPSPTNNRSNGLLSTAARR